MKKLVGKVAVITGASSGIGEASARRLASEGACVVLAARRIERLKRLQQELESAGGAALAVAADVTRRADMQAVFDKARERFQRVDILINNAGIMPLSLMKNVRVDDWERVIDVNLKGVLYGIAAALPTFRQQKSGHIVNLSSAAGRRVYPGCAVYCATKFGVRAISEGLRMELDPAERIRVTVIEPGAVATELPGSIGDDEQKQRIASFKKAIQFLEADDIAESIHYAVSQREHVNVDEILVMPREQGH